MMFQHNTVTHNPGFWVALVFVALTLVLAAASPTGAEQATAREMRNVVQNWTAQTVRTHGGWAGEANPSINGEHEIIEDGVLLARVYDLSPQGYVLVPALKELPPVMMYSDESNWSDAADGPGQMIREILKSRFDAFASVYGSVAASQPPGEGLFDASQKVSWGKFDVTAKEYRFDAVSSAEAQNGPLLTSSWNQRAPYNNDCPMGDGGRCVVGCTATSLSQILDYWEWPEKGVGSHSYYWSGDGAVIGDWLTADFSDTYDWANMVDSCDLGCSPDQEAALAELCHEAGVAVEMNYGYSSSGAGMNYSVFSKYFRYAPDIKREDRINHTQQSWFDIIRTEIDAGRVCWYGINSHAIVCDGYRDEYGQLEYHMNYGWAGSYTAWFVLDNLYCYWIDGDVCPWDEDYITYNIRPQYAPIINAIGADAVEYNGDGDGLIEPGEQALIYPMLRNFGNDATGLHGELNGDGSYVSVITGSADFPAPLEWGGSCVVQTPYVVSIDPGTPDNYQTVLTLDVTADGGYATTQSCYLFVGTEPGLAAGFDDTGEWQHTSQTIVYTDQWHKETYRYLSAPNCYKFGGDGPEDYRSTGDGGLTSPPFLLPYGATLRFFDWMDAEYDVDNTAWDGGIVMISTSAGTWEQVFPPTGYPYTIIDNPASPFEPFTGCYSGQHEWQEETIDLSGYSGLAQVMFRFGADGYVTAEGWYVDDIQIYNTAPGANVVVKTCDSLTVTFSNVFEYGTTYSLPYEPTLPEEYVAVPSGSFELLTNDFMQGGSVTVTFRYDETLLTRSESGLKLLHYDGAEWVDCTSGLNSVDNEITGVVTTLSPFALAESSSCCQDRVGNANGEGGDEPTIGDINALISAIYTDQVPDAIAGCFLEADVNQSGGVNPVYPDDFTITDINLLIEYLYIKGPKDPIFNPDGAELLNCL